MATPSLLEIRDRSWTFDFLLCAGVALVTVGPYAAGGEVESVGLGLLLVVPLMARRQFPTAGLALMFLGALGQLILATPHFSLVAIPIMIYTLARFASLRLGHLGLAAGLLGSVLGPGVWTLANGLYAANALLFAVLVATCAAIVAAAYLLGRRRREGLENSQAQARSAAERERLMLAEQEQRDRMATVAERNRIARELHDIVAHSLSVIVVQAEGGRALAAKRPEQASEVLGTIAETSREALEEMRQMVGLLRGNAPEGPAAYAPAPGPLDIPELVRKTSGTAELAVFGTAPPVGAAVGLTAYRIVQESLTNVLKHAGPAARARVTLAYTADSIEIEVADDGRGAAAGPDGRGHGLQGMHERVALHGGRLSAEPRPGGGFVVRASLPFSPPAPDPAAPGATR